MYKIVIKQGTVAEPITKKGEFLEEFDCYVRFKICCSDDNSYNEAYHKHDLYTGDVTITNENGEKYKPQKTKISNPEIVQERLEKYYEKQLGKSY